MSNLPSRFWLRSKDEPEVARAYVRRDLLTRGEAARDPEVQQMVLARLRKGQIKEVTEPLLTREEAANDPEVRKAVKASMRACYKGPLCQHEVTNDE